MRYIIQYYCNTNAVIFVLFLCMVNILKVLFFRILLLHSCYNLYLKYKIHYNNFVNMIFTKIRFTN